MTKREAKPFKQMLTVLRARLRGDVSGLADAALNKNPAAGSGSTLSNHMADMGSDQYEQDFSLSLMANEEEVLEQIDAALMRIESGTYGACDECGSKIPKMRLNAIPFTAYCVRCADQIQRGG
ncbi:MAG: transcriptional regulator [Planctomycetaceae bacterium]|nr:transcriptional regulator [Planctomycetaceae bacterium]